MDTTLNEVINLSVDNTALANIKDANELALTIKELKITNQDEYQNSGNFLKQIKTVQKNIEDERKKITSPLDEAKKRVMDFFRDPVDRLAEAEIILKKAILSYQKEQEQLAEEERRKAEAKAKAEEEKRRKELEERAIKAEEKGKISKAEMLREKAEDVYVPTVVLSPKIDNIKGISTKKIWKAKVLNYKAIPQSVYINDEKVKVAIISILDKLAAATKGAMPIEGVEFYQEDSLSAGRL